MPSGFQCLTLTARACGLVEWLDFGLRVVRRRRETRSGAQAISHAPPRDASSSPGLQRACRGKTRESCGTMLKPDCGSTITISIIPSSSRACGAICAPLPYRRELASAMNIAGDPEVGRERPALEVERVVARIAFRAHIRAIR